MPAPNVPLFSCLAVAGCALGSLLLESAPPLLAAALSVATTADAGWSDAVLALSGKDGDNVSMNLDALLPNGLNHWLWSCTVLSDAAELGACRKATCSNETARPTTQFLPSWRWHFKMQV